MKLRDTSNTEQRNLSNRRGSIKTEMETGKVREKNKEEKINEKREMQKQVLNKIKLTGGSRQRQ